MSGPPGAGVLVLVPDALDGPLAAPAWLLPETGTEQPEAIALYAVAGWSRVTPYGEWKHSPDSVCFGRSLT